MGIWSSKAIIASGEESVWTKEWVFVGWEGRFWVKTGAVPAIGNWAEENSSCTDSEKRESRRGLHGIELQVTWLLLIGVGGGGVRGPLFVWASFDVDVRLCWSPPLQSLWLKFPTLFYSAFVKFFALNKIIEHNYVILFRE